MSEQQPERTEQTTEQTREEWEQEREAGVEIPDNDDVKPGDKPQPRSDRDDGAQDDGSDRVADEDYQPGDDEGTKR